MKITRVVALISVLLINVITYAQKTISEGTMMYDISIQANSADGKVNNGLKGSKVTIYLKGSQSKTEMSSTLGTETTIYNSKTGNAAILKEYSGQKLMITLTKDNWNERNSRFTGATFENTADTKVIEGYNCKHAVAKLADGSSISVYYTPDLLVMNKDYDQSFKNLGGFPVEYEFQTPRLVFKYALAKLDFSPLPSSIFELPKSGYRVMSYDENKKGKKEE